MPESVAHVEPDGRKLLETRSIDYVPDAERHGSLFSQFTLWLSANLQVTAIFTGALAVVLGGTDISWILGLIVPGTLYYVATRHTPPAIPERLILPVEQD